ncbi:protein arginine kinase [Halobacillus massiliensis]|uniref:protein arginine kinase n=1 Tax=Halobacillus massiliensis TaxID=1926286 RepID=UPI0009E35B64|nr:protein arginine kinase [Halobacillus massiliensis]
MSLEQFMNEAISPWMNQEGPDSDIVLSSRIRLARNLQKYPFPIIADEERLEEVLNIFKDGFAGKSFRDYENFEVVQMSDLQPTEKRVLVEKHLVSPHLIEQSKHSASLISQNEQVSIMINEEDHIRIQLYFPGFQLDRALEQASQLDDWLEEKVDYAFDENRGYLTACPTNVGTGMRASVMMHLPALTMTQQITRMTPAINQLGLVVRGIYGEGSEALGNLFQISNQITLGKSEEDIVEDLHSVVRQLIDQERKARQTLMQRSGMQLEDRVFRSFGVLKHSRIIESKEAAKCLSDLRLGIDLGFIDNIPKTILNELMVLTQPGFLQQYAKESLTPSERDIRRASLIRERLLLEKNE